MTEYLQAADAGNPPENAAFLARYPDLETELAEFLADQSDLARLVASPRPPDSPAGRPFLVEPTQADSGEGSTHADATAPPDRT